MQQHTIDTPRGPLIAYDTGRGGTPLVLVNALGQGLPAWAPLIALLTGYRLISWHPRTSAAAPTVADHVDDLARVLAAHDIDRCHLIGWCTGPKVMVGFHRRRPGVAASMVFLNGSFKLTGESAELDTPFESNLEFVCRTVAGQPTAADKLRALFAGGGTATAAPAGLAGEVRAPFRSADSLRDYAGQMLDFWAYDALADAPHVRVPVLAIGAGADAVVSTRRLAHAAGRFPDARFVEVPDASHYLLYERPDIVAEAVQGVWHEL